MRKFGGLFPCNEKEWFVMDVNDEKTIHNKYNKGNRESF